MNSQLIDLIKMDLIVDFPSRTSLPVPQSGKRYCIEAASTSRRVTVDNNASQTEEDIEGLIVGFPRRCSTAESSTVPATANAATKPRPRVTSFQQKPPQVWHVENWSNNPTLWYTESNLHSFQRDKDQHVAMMKMIQRFSGIRNRNASKEAASCPTMAKYAQMRMEQAKTTSWGLEHHIDTTVSFEEMTARREEHCRAVLVEQWRHTAVCGGGQSSEYVGGTEGDSVRQCQDAIAKVSREYSERSRLRARVIGTLHSKTDDDSHRKSVLTLQGLGCNKLEVVGGPSLPTPPSA